MMWADAAQAGCSTQETSRVGNDPALEAKARAALQKLFETTQGQGDSIPGQSGPGVPVSHQGRLHRRRSGRGRRDVRPGGKVLDYYNATALSYGFQAGAQKFSQAMFLMNDNAKKYLDSADGWSIGMGPSVVVVDEGVAKSMTTTTLQSGLRVHLWTRGSYGKGWLCHFLVAVCA